VPLLKSKQTKTPEQTLALLRRSTMAETNEKNTTKTPSGNAYDENGIRQCHSGMRDNAPTLQFVCGVGLCPGCGACIGDYKMGQNEGMTKLEKPLNFSSTETKVEAKNDLKSYINGPKEIPNNALPCAAPVQIKMSDEKPNIGMHKNPDAVCNCCCLWLRPAALAFLITFSLPTILAAKYGLGWIAVATITFCLFISLFARVLAICFPKCFTTITPPLKDTFMNVIDIKRLDLIEVDEAGKKGLGAKAGLYAQKGWAYIKAMFLGFFCCRFFRPSVIFTFAKVLIVMVYTEVLMVVSAYFYFLFRFSLGSMTWTLCSLTAWVREFMNSNAIKARVVNMKYPAWQEVTKAGAGVEGKPEIEAPDVECCGIKCGECFFSCCKVLPCCKCCDWDLCGLVCEISCPLLCEMFSVLLDTFMELFSAIILVGKALYFTELIVVAGKSKVQEKGGETTTAANAA